VRRGAPAVSRAIDALVRSGLVDRQPDPDNRRRLALRLTELGRERLNSPPPADASLEGRIGKLAHSELRALERGFEILERLPR
jgi:DNA-binding MarR family transcriptional regulator